MQEVPAESMQEVPAESTSSTTPVDQPSSGRKRQIDAAGDGDVAQRKKTTSARTKGLLVTLRSLTLKTYRRAPLRNKRMRANITSKANDANFQQDLEMMRYGPGQGQGLWPISLGYDFASCVDAYLARLAIASHAHWLQWL